MTLQNIQTQISDLVAQVKSNSAHAGRNQRLHPEADGYWDHPVCSTRKREEVDQRTVRKAAECAADRRGWRIEVGDLTRVIDSLESQREDETFNRA